MGIFKRVKSKLLTKLFNDWVSTETDLETLRLTTQLIKQREIDVSGIKPIIGFRSDSTNQIN